MRRPPLPALLLLAVLLACTDPTRYDSKNAVPSPPLLTRIELTTHNDIVPCLRIHFSNSNPAPATLVLEREAPGQEFLVVSRGIPAGLNRFDDLEYPSTIEAEYVRFRYRLYAVSAEDSVSPASNIDSVFLLRDTPRLDSVTWSNGFPMIYYHVTGLQGVRCTLDVVKRDFVLASRSYPETFREGTVAWPCAELPLDTLRAMSRRLPSDNGVFGVRLRAGTGGLRNLRGLSVIRFTLPGGGS